MSGKVVPTTPWARQYLAAVKPDELALIEAQIPDLHHITVGARTKPGDWSVRLVFNGFRTNDREVVGEVLGARTIAGGCLAVLRKVAA